MILLTVIQLSDAHRTFKIVVLSFWTTVSFIYLKQNCFRSKQCGPMWTAKSMESSIDPFPDPFPVQVPDPLPNPFPDRSFFFLWKRKTSKWQTFWLNNSEPIPMRQSSLKGNRRPAFISSSNTFQSKISKFSKIFFTFFYLPCWSLKKLEIIILINGFNCWTRQFIFYFIRRTVDAAYNKYRLGLSFYW